MTVHQPHSSLVVVANEHCARFLKYLHKEHRLIEQITMANPAREQAHSTRFARQVAQHIELKCAADKHTGVYLIAPQPFLRVLVEGVTQDDPERVTAMRADDLTALSEDHILVRMTDLLSASAKQAG